MGSNSGSVQNTLTLINTGSSAIDPVLSLISAGMDLAAGIMHLIP